MRLGIMQPYFFPYLGHFQLIARTQRWIIFDVVKYSRKSWINRNRVLKPGGGWQYITVPVSAPSLCAISDVRVLDKVGALARITGQLDHYRKYAPYFSAVISMVRETFGAAQSDLLVDLNRHALRVICERLGISFRAEVCSEMGLDLPPIEHPGQWALEISKRVGAESYINPESGQSIFHPEEWVRAGIRLDFMKPIEFRYDCGPYTFEPGLSVLDVLMWNSAESVSNAIHKANAARNV